eukprot:maker-scaffold628_size122696-snap-gene-0.32 protein:Tk01148 transcript:maker-scaffold628_size122696-snap-gene-0.32-mRNA-1 annotation:"cysteine-rich protein 2-binding"
MSRPTRSGTPPKHAREENAGSCADRSLFRSPPLVGNWNRAEMSGMGTLPANSSNPLQRISLYEEEQLLQRVSTALRGVPRAGPVQAEEVAAWRRLLRKLKLRRTQRRNGIPVFQLDSLARKISQHRPIETVSNLSANRTLDRFHNEKSHMAWSVEHLNSPVCHRVVKDPAWSMRTSPFTGRELKPFIRRDMDSWPLRLRLHHELSLKLVGQSPKRRHPITYCYLAPQHVRSINVMAQQFFWPGIDVSENLQYPDFTCVALYRQMVIGFAFLVPDVSHTEAYISFLFTHPDWRRGGIAKFMIYHLVQSCSGRDITLHVSANNPAVMLYQNFGFKVEERIVDFYDKYLPPESRECKHALLLRLSR